MAPGSPAGDPGGRGSALVLVAVYDSRDLDVLLLKGGESKMKSTPGPWKYVGRNGLVYIVEKYPDFQRENCLIAECAKAEYARLISACPDLLEALHKIANIPRYPISDPENIAFALAAAREIARAAIVKAEGE